MSQLNAVHIFQTYEGVSRQITIGVSGVSDSSGNPNNSSRSGSTGRWPFVTLNGFEPLMKQSIEQTGANFVGLTPLVSEEQRIDFEQYAYDNKQWIKNGLELTGDIEELSIIMDFVNQRIPKQIHCLITESEESEEAVEDFEQQDQTFEESIEEGVAEIETEACPTKDLYAPVRHVTPIVNMWEQLNFDAFSFYFFKRVYDGMIAAKEAILSEVLNLDEVIFESSGSWPASFMAAPVYNTPNPEAKDRSIVAVLTAEMPWHRYFVNLLPEDIFGVFLVVKNTCNQTFSYIIDGGNVTFLGPYDAHDIEYDEFEVSDMFTTFQSIADCRYSFHLYPSDDFVNKYQTTEPFDNAIGVGIVFAICGVAFIIYDCLVTKRKNTLMAEATKTGVLVNSLFPENVRDRLLEDALKAAKSKEDKKEQQEKKNNATMASAIGSVVNPRSSQSTMSSDTLNGTGDGENVLFYKTKPIADLFPNATVLFSDLVGKFCKHSMKTDYSRRVLAFNPTSLPKSPSNLYFFCRFYRLVVRS